MGLATSVLLSPHGPKHTAVMGIGKFFNFPSSSTSSNSSSRPQGGYRPPPSPGSSKVDCAYGIDSSDPSVPKWSAQNYRPCDNDAPPAYSPKKGSEFNDWATDSKKPVPHKPHPHAVYFPTPSQIHASTDSSGEDPLQALKYYDIVIILDDSHSMTKADNLQNISRWNQVSNRSLPHRTHATVVVGGNQHFCLNSRHGPRSKR